MFGRTSLDLFMRNTDGFGKFKKRRFDGPGLQKLWICRLRQDLYWPGS